MKGLINNVVKKCYLFLRILRVDFIFNLLPKPLLQCKNLQYFLSLY